jgi:hypothetical protein
MVTLSVSLWLQLRDNNASTRIISAGLQLRVGGMAGDELHEQESFEL